MTDNEFIGKFRIPRHLMDQIDSYVPPTPIPDSIKLTSSTNDTDINTYINLTNIPRDHWTEVGTYDASNGTSKHRVYAYKTIIYADDVTHVEYKCSCQSFKFQKKGTCKHIERYKAEGSIELAVSDITYEWLRKFDDEWLRQLNASK